MNSKAIFSALPSVQSIFNPSYESNQSTDSWCKNGSRKYFGTDSLINGEYFRSRTDNQYFRIINKDYQIKELQKFTHFFPSTQLYDVEYDPIKHVIIRLEFIKNKGYFVESNQSITISNPDVTILSDIKTIKELLSNVPKFIPLDKP